MEIILLALIAGLLFTNLILKDDVFIVVFVTLIAAAVMFGIAWGSNALLEMFGFYL